MIAARLFRLNEILTLASGLAVAATWTWMKLKVPEYRLAHLNSPRPPLGVVQAYRRSPRPETEKLCVAVIFQAALALFLLCAIISFAAGFVAALRGPGYAVHS